MQLLHIDERGMGGERGHSDTVIRHDESFSARFGGSLDAYGRVAASVTDRTSALLSRERFGNFLRMLVPYRMQTVARASTNRYHDSKADEIVDRRQTNAEHVHSSLKLAEYFLFAEEEFAPLRASWLRILRMLMYHDDVEIATDDLSIADTERRNGKHERETEAMPWLIAEYPEELRKSLRELDAEYREGKTPEARFVRAIDKMDALLHELQYPEDWGPKGFTRDKVVAWFRPAFVHSPTFLRYFDSILAFLETNGYFETP